MSRQIQLTIADPCHENWDQMTRAEKGRFCAACQKQVVDFTAMTDSQVAAFFKKPNTGSSKEGSVCGRFYQDQLDRDIQIPKKRIPWVKYFFQFALPAFLLSMKATAQGKVRLTYTNDIMEPTPVPAVMLQQAPALLVRSTPQLLVAEDKKIIGKIVDEKGEPVPFATVMIKGTKNATMSNASGLFNIMPGKEWQSAVLIVSSVGFDLSEINVMNDRRSVNVVLYKSRGMEMGVIVCTKPSSKKQAKPIPLLTQKLMDTAFKFFKVFPNPVASGASLHIEWKKTEEGYYLLELIDLSGKKVYSKEIWIDAEARLLNIEVPSVAAGSYFLRATDKQSGKDFTEKIVIQ